MLELTVQKRGLGRYDDVGALAASGEVNQAVLSHLLAHPYFEREGPKSLDRYDFPLDIVDDLSAADAAATLVAFTANSVALGARQLPEQPELWIRSEEHTSELQSLMRISYAVFCLKKKRQTHQTTSHT